MTKGDRISRPTNNGLDEATGCQPYNNISASVLQLSRNLFLLDSHKKSAWYYDREFLNGGFKRAPWETLSWQSRKVPWLYIYIYADMAIRAAFKRMEIVCNHHRDQINVFAFSVMFLVFLDSFIHMYLEQSWIEKVLFIKIYVWKVLNYIVLCTFYAY